MIISSAEVLVASPGRNFVTLRLTTDDGLTGLGDATVNGRELAVASYLATTSCRCWSAGTRTGSRTPGSTSTGAPTGGADRSRWPPSPPSTPRCGTSRPRRPTCRCTSCSAGAAGSVAWPTGTPPAATCRSSSTRSGRTRPRATGRSGSRPGCPGSTRSTGWRPAATPVPARLHPLRPRAGPAVRGAGRGAVGHPGLPAPHPGRLRGGAQRVRAGAAAAPRRPPPAHARSRRPSSARTLEPYDLFWLEDVTPAENQSALRLVRAAHDHPARDRRGVQHDLGLPGADREPAHRLRPVAGHARRGHHRPAPDLRLRGGVPDPAPGCTGRPTSHRSAWPRRCTSASPSPTSASRST